MLLLCLLFCFFFFFKQKTAYEMRISDWSSDVCSSDLTGGAGSLTWWGLRRSLCPHAPARAALWTTPADPPPPMTASRSSLLLGKLRALVGAHLPGVELVDGSFPGGAALLAGEPPVAWVLLDENPIGSLGPALVVAGRQGASSVEIVVDDADAAGRSEEHTPELQ